jgi:hypothetical protein
MTMISPYFAFVGNRNAECCAINSGKLLPGWMCAIIFLFAILVANHAAAQISVTTPYQGKSENQCSLQEAMYATQFGGPYALDQTDPDGTYQTGCTDPSGLWYQIVLQAGQTYSFDHYWDGDGHNPFGPTATPIVCNVVDIVGNGATLQWIGSGYSRMFAVGYATFSPTSGPMTGTFCGVVTPNLTLHNVYIKGFQVKGGDGRGGGGGGLGAGGAIYIGRLPGKDQPSLTIQNSTLDGNTATGGRGGACGNFSADDAGCNGGGGGLAGNGGAGTYKDGGGGGGGSRGDGGAGVANAGGGGGGTVYGNGDAHDNIGGAAGVYCGGNGGDDGNDGHSASASCPGGGGGGGGDPSLLCGVGLGPCGNAGAGSYGGGGGGGGGGGHGNGGNGGFGGGGGSVTECCDTGLAGGGNGGFGAGAGYGATLRLVLPGYFGGYSNGTDGGGQGGAGAGLGGAIFSDGGSVTVQNSTIANNKVADGSGPAGVPQSVSSGAAIFLRNAPLTVEASTIAANSGDSGVGITVFNDNKDIPTSFTLHNTIIDAKGGFGNDPCFYLATTADAVTFTSAGNLITDGGKPNFSSNEFPQQSDCSVGTVSNTDPQLGPLRVNSPGNTPTMEISYGSSPAIDAGDDGVAISDGITTDQRGVTRPQGPLVDIGAYEATVKYPLIMQVSPSGGGYTSPTGTVWEDPNAVVGVSATAASGYYFLNWSGNVASANSTSTTVTMPAQPVTITGNFQLHDFSITSSPNPLNLKLGGSASSTVTVSSLGNFADKVTLTGVGTGIPVGVTVSLSPSSLIPAVGGSPTATLSFTAGPSVTPANFSETVTGSSTGIAGTLSHAVVETVTMTVTAADLINVVNENQVLGCINNSGLAQSLNAKLNAFQLLSTKGQNVATVNTMAAFRYEVQAQSGVHIATTCTDNGTQFSPPQTLLTDAQYLLTSMGALPPADPIMGSVVNSSGVGISGATVSLLSSSKTVLATSMTDALGFYYFAGTNVLNQGSSYTVKVSPPTGYKSATPATQSFTWSTSAVQLNRVVLN